MLPMNNLEKAAWSTLSISIQSTVRASLQAADLTTVELGTVRPVSIGEVLVWAKQQSVTFATHVIGTLNPDGCTMFGGRIEGRVGLLLTEAQKLNSAFRKFETESLDDYLKCDALIKHGPLIKKGRVSSGEFTHATPL